MEEHSCAWKVDPPGALVFTYPAQYHEVRRQLKHIKLRTHHVVISEAFMPLLRETIRRLPSKMHVRMRTTNRLAIIPDDSTLGAVRMANTYISHLMSNVERIVTQSAPADSYDANPRMSTVDEI